MTTYAFPSIVPSTSSMVIAANSHAFISPEVASVQSASRNGEHWQMTMVFSNLSSDESRELSGFLAKLNGIEHRFTVHDHANVYGGAGGGTPLVVGGSGSGKTLATDGWPSSTLVMLQGDNFTVNGELKKCTADVTTNGSGEATISFWPSLRSSPADNSPITIDSPTGTFLLLPGNDSGWSNVPGIFSDYTVQCMEDVLA